MICVLYFQATVMNWIAKGYVPGADMNYIPDSAREPYTAARAKNGFITKSCGILAYSFSSPGTASP